MTDNNTDEDDRHRRPFLDFLAELRKGAVADELTRKLNELVEAVDQTSKGGSLTFTLKVGWDKKLNMVSVDDAVVAKIPAPDRGRSLYFVDDDSNPVRDDPHQLAFQNIRAVPEKAAKRA